MPRTAFPALFYVNQEESTASSNYHALQTSLRMNSWRGLTAGVNFVWSHSIDDASDSEDFIPNAAQPNNSLIRAWSVATRISTFAAASPVNFGYEFPKMSGSWSRLKNGWGVDGVVNLQDGQPFQLNYNFEGDYSGSGEGFDRPDVVGPIRYGSGHSSVDLSSFRCLARSATRPGLGVGGDSDCLAGTRHFGDLGRNSLRAPSFKEFNFSVFKNTAITERVNLQIRAEFFNLFNHPNFSNPNLAELYYRRGEQWAGLPPARHRLLPLTATGDVGIGNPFLGGGGPRGIQFAAKITF